MNLTKTSSTRHSSNIAISSAMLDSLLQKSSSDCTGEGKSPVKVKISLSAVPSKDNTKCCVTEEKTISLKSPPTQRSGSRFNRSISDEPENGSPSSHTSFNRSTYYTAKCSQRGFRSCSRFNRSNSDEYKNRSMYSDSSLNRTTYYTPEISPRGFRSCSRFNRSNSDEYKNRSMYSDSSLNRTMYYTPEISPRGFNSAKRPNRRWSDVENSFGMDRSGYLNSAKRPNRRWSDVENSFGMDRFGYLNSAKRPNRRWSDVENSFGMDRSGYLNSAKRPNRRWSYVENSFGMDRFGYLNSAKRPNRRWSDVENSFGVDRSGYLSQNGRRKNRESSHSAVEPELIGYQMVGDSQFCRFGQQVLGLQKVPMANSSGRIGLCISGQTITDLHQRVREKFYPISDKIILMIGTNDFLRHVNVMKMCEELSSLVRTLQKRTSNIILLTLPPIPKLERTQNRTHFRLLEEYNSHIRSLEDGDKLQIADISPLYMSQPPYQRCKMHLFELYFAGPAKRFDCIHLNRVGLYIIRNYILEKFS